MNKKFNAILCIAVFLGSMTNIQANALEVVSGDTLNISSEQSETSITNNGNVTVWQPGKLTVNNGIQNNDTFYSYGSVTAQEIINATAGSLTNDSGASLKAEIFNNSGNLNNVGTLQTTASENDFINSGTVTNWGTITSNQIQNQTGGNFTNNNSVTAGSVTNSGTFINDSSGTLTADFISNQNIFTNNGIIGDGNNKTDITNTGTFTNNNTVTAGEIQNQTGGIFTNNSILTADSVTNQSSFTNDVNGSLITESITNANSFTNNGIIGDGNNKTDITNTGTFTNNNTVTAGEIQNQTGGIFTNNSILTADSVTNQSSFTNDVNGSLTAGTINNSGNLNNVGTFQTTASENDFINSGTVTNWGTITSNQIQNQTGGNFTNNNSVTAGSVTNGGTFINDSSGTLTADFISNQNIFTNNGTIQETSGLTIENTGTFNNNKDITAGNITNTGTFNNYSGSAIIADSIDNRKDFLNEGTIGSDAEKINITNSSNFKNNNSIVANEIQNVNNAVFTNNKDLNVTTLTNNGLFHNQETEGNTVADAIINNSQIINSQNIQVGDLTNAEGASIETSGTFEVTGNFENKGTIINSGVFDSGTGSTMTNDGIFISSGANAGMNATDITNNNIFGADNGADLELDNIVNNGTIQITNGSTLNITSQTDDLGGKILSTGENNNLGVTGSDIVSNLQVGDGNTNTSLTLTTGNVVENAVINVTENAIFNIGTDTTTPSVIFNDNETDTWNGGVNLVNGTLTLDNFKENTSGTASYAQSGGDLYLNNNSSLYAGDSSLITGGNMYIDNSSIFHSQANGFVLDEVKHSGMLGAMNAGREDYTVNGDMIIGDALTGDNQADFTIDVHGRSNWASQHGTDHFIADNITEDTGLSSATINIADWGLAGDIFGWDAPIDSHITLENIFRGNISENINLTSTNKEVFTPIGWYQLNNHGGIGGTYTLDLTRFNPQVYRGQVTTVAQWMNQLAIDDMLFNHSMVLPSFKDEDGGVAYSGMMANRYASTMPQFAPYQYSRKDGGLWYKMYGTFETLQMSQGLGNVGNNAYGALIGADFGLKELRNGWKFMPTAYIGYNGAHQYWAGMGAYQNGGQAGFLGTWYKNNFIIGGLVYGGIYDNSMDVAGRVDSTFNYFAGAATKLAYNWRFHRDWVLQPNLFVAYNFFGQQNWHSDFGQMGMMSGMLNGVNMAPGLNLIWEKETFSIYATLQYMYNLNGAVGGRAGNVGLPHIYMERGYIQYGLGFTKRFTDRFSGYLQAVFRNVGRTGVGFQMGFNFLLGK